MSNSTSIAAVALSVEQLLTRSFIELDALEPAAFRALPTVTVVRSQDFANVGNGSSGVIRFPMLTIFCYRVDINRTMRAPWSAVAHHDGEIHLPLDVHLMLTPFDSDAEAELKILGAAMQCLEQQAIVAGPQLHPQGGWEHGDAIQLINEDLVTEDVLRTFDTLPTDFRLSVSYVARITRIDAPDEPGAPDVMAAVRGLTPSPVPTP
ncbi:MAG: Pvc16 family protein [Actinomycetota bacterium]